MVLGARGFFGRHAVGLLRADGVAAVPVGHDDVDVEDRVSLRALVHPNDVLLDAVGPFQRRIALPQGADTGAVEASMSDGLLTIEVGKAVQAQPKRVEVRARG